MAPGQSEGRAPGTAAYVGSAVPVCFPLAGYADGTAALQGQNDSHAGHHRLHGADDLITLFGLRPLWERSVKPYMAGHKQLQGVGNEKKRSSDEGDQSTAGPSSKPLIMDKTYASYVQDLPGRVRPNRKLMNRYSTAAASANASGAALPPLPPELSGRTTMRDIVFRPETTVQRVGPFDEESLRAAFTVAAGDVPDIDPALLESDEIERSSPSKRKKKRKNQREHETGASGGESAAAAKRSKLRNFASGRGA